MTTASISAHRALPVSKPVDHKGTGSDVKFSYNPQDEVVMSPGTITLHDVGPGLETPRVELETNDLPANASQQVYAQSDRRFPAAVAMASVDHTVETFEKALGKPVHWAFGGARLGITPDHGKMLNAYYSRQDGGVFFFHDTDPVTGKTIYSADSGEVTAHETGHALLDSQRPGYFSAWSPVPAAFHESFGDTMALLMSLQNPRVIDKVAQQTGGDLHRPNIAAAMGEELGETINHTAGHDVTGGNYTRNDINNFVWKDPSSLPDKAPANKLSREPHSLSRLWTGAFYDILAGIVKRDMQQGMSARQAIKAAGAEGLKLVADLMHTAPKGDFTFADMARALIQADSQYNDGRNTQLMHHVFAQRKILPQTESISADLAHNAVPQGTRSLSVELDGPEYGKFQGATVKTLLSGSEGNLLQDANDRLRLENDVKHMIKQGRILYTEPHQALKPRDYFDKNGRPYFGVVRWTDGKMHLERVKIAS